MSEKSTPQMPTDREVLPIPNEAYAGPVLYDANDPAAVFPPIQEIRPPKGAPNVLVVLIDDVGFGASSAFGGPINTPDRGAPGGQRAEVQPLPHHRPLLADAGGAADRAQPPLGRHGRHHRAGGGRARLHLDDPQHQGRRRQDAARQRLLHRPVRQVPRGAGLGDEPDGTVRALADDAGLREVLRLHRRRDQPVVPGGLRQPHPRRGAERPLLPLHRGHGRPRRSTGSRRRRRSTPTSPSSSTGRPAPPTPRTRCPRSGSRSTRASSTTAGTRSASGPSPARRSSGVIPADAELTPRPEQIPAWDDMPEELKPVLRRQMETYAGFLEHTDHQRRPAGRPARAGRDPRRHPHLLHHRRQRRLGRRDPQRHLQRDDQLQRRRRSWRPPSS